jgi:hypothetical protein
MHQLTLFSQLLKLKEPTWGDAQCTSESHDVQEGDVAFAPLDAADVGPIKPALQGQLLLGPTELFPQAADPSAKKNPRISHITLPFSSPPVH